MKNKYNKKGSITKILLLVLLFGTMALLLYLYNSSLFERKKPHIFMKDTIFWNLKKAIPIEINDESGIKFVRITLKSKKDTVVLVNEEYKIPLKQVNILANLPKTAFFSEKSKLVLNIEAYDNSKWNFFMGNKAKKNINIKLDTKKPELYIVNNSYSIVRGGVGLVIFKASDENLKDLYIKSDTNNIFKPQAFYKEGYYISFIPWEHNKQNFSAYIVASDKAGNETREKIKFYLLGKKYRTSTIKASDKFIDGKISDLAKVYYKGDVETITKPEKFKFINETLREDNEKIINEITTKISNQTIENFHLFPFYPLKNAAAVASFGDHRYYEYKDEIISESYHLGLDLASTAKADIVASNDGTVVYAQENGIYGNSLIISHKLGVYSLYGHCTDIKVSLGDEIKKGETIARTGVSGLALGDHLHFGIIVRGKAVRPEEWMDAKWFIDNVTMVIKDAKKIIDRK